jgi:glycerophosphoryl diester phosphodiesterase
MRVVVLTTLLLAACGSGSSASDPDAAGAAADAPTAADAPAADDAAPVTPDAAPGAPDAGPAPDKTYRNSLSICWTDATCPRVMVIGHGGLWDAFNAPYDSNAAIAAAYAGGMEGVKIDVRITMDGVPVISHSSPIEIYESLDCAGKKIEEMTAAEVTACHRLPSSTETFQRLDDVLDYLRGKMVVQLTVKLSSDYAGTIALVRAKNAEDFAFFEISTSELQNLVPTLPGGDQVYYLINVASSYAEVDTLVALANPRAFMVEMDPDPSVPTIVSTKLHPHGMRSFTYDSSATAQVADLVAHYDQGFDVVSTQQGANGVTARMQANQARGVTPP